MNKSRLLYVALGVLLLIAVALSLALDTTLHELEHGVLLAERRGNRCTHRDLGDFRFDAAGVEAVPLIVVTDPAGNVVRQLAGPGRHVHLPFPLERRALITLAPRPVPAGRVHVVHVGGVVGGGDEVHRGRILEVH